MKNLKKTYQRNLEQIDQLARMAEQPKVVSACVPAVSKWSVGHHLHHLALVNERALTCIECCVKGTVPADVKPMILPARIILLLGKIPPGRQAPETVKPDEDKISESAVSLRSIRIKFAALEGRLSEIGECSKSMPHPVLGGMKPAQWIRFNEVHNSHHMRIIHRILGQS